MLYDLTHPMSETMTVSSGDAPPVFRRVQSLPESLSNVSEYHFKSHQGTHIDAPLHFFADGEAIDAIDVARLTGRGWVIPIDKPPCEPVGVADVIGYADRIKGLPFVFFSYGWAKYYGTPAYFEHPYLGTDVGQLLHDLGVGCVGMDTLTPDLPVPLRREGYSAPVHRSLLGRNILIIENTASLEAVVEKDLRVYAFPLKVAGGDGAPVRLVASDEI